MTRRGFARRLHVPGLRRRPGAGDAAQAAGLALALGLLLAMVPAKAQPADSGELQWVATELGVAHPPGYPLYTMAAHLFGRLVDSPPGRAATATAVTGLGAVLAPLGWPLGLRYGAGDLAAPGGGWWAFATNAFSAVLAAMALWLAFRLALRLTGAWPAGLLAATALALSPTFLAQSVVANVRMPTTLLALLVLCLAARALGADGTARAGARQADARRADAGNPVGAASVRPVAAVALAAGLAAGHHPSLAVYAAPAVALAWLRVQRAGRGGRALAAAAAALALSLLPLAYLPLRDGAGAVLAPGSLGTARGLYEHVTAYGFRGDMLAFTAATDLADRAVVLGNILLLQLGPVLPFLAVAGLVWLARRNRSMAALLASGTALTGLLALTYRAPQTMEYVLPATAVLAVLAGTGAHALAAGLVAAAGGSRISRGAPGRLATGAAALLPLALALTVVGARRQLPADVADALPRPEPVVAVLRCAPEDALVLAGWHHATALWFAASRSPAPTPTVAYVHPEGAEPIGQTWRRRLGESAGAVVVTQRSAQMGGLDAALWPLAGTAFFTTEPTAPGACVDAAGSPARLLSFGNDLAALGAALALRAVHVEIAPWAPPTAYVTVAAAAPVTETLALFAQLVDPRDGRVLAQADRSVGADRWLDPRALTLRLPLWTFREPLPPALDLLVGAYRSGPDGVQRLPVAALAGGAQPRPAGAGAPGGPPGAYADAFAAGSLPVAPGPAAPAARPGAVPYAHAMQLLRADVRHRGEELVADLTWLAEAGASLSDYTVSVQARGDGWAAQHDGTPALGMIPTLKWLPGMVIRDRHRLTLPPGLDEDADYEVTVGVYDAFSLEPLAVTDRERVAAGQGLAARIRARAHAR